MALEYKQSILEGMKHVALVVLVLLGAVGVYSLVSRFAEPGVPVPTPSGQGVGDFSEAGNLIINNPGLKADTWYLVYEKPGTPGLLTELVFDGGSTCTVRKESAPCPAGLSAGLRVTVQGQVRTDHSVQVASVAEVQPREVRDILLYYYNSTLDQGPGGIQCSAKGLVAVPREIFRTITPIQDVVRLLLRGELTDQERAQGVTTEFPLPGVELAGAALNDGTLTLTFRDPQNMTSGGSCRVSILWAQIEATALQFPEVKKVRFMPGELFQP
jgi:hypothetical protein